MALTGLPGHMLAHIEPAALANVTALLCQGALLVVLVIACRWDIRYRRVPNPLILIVAILGLIEAQARGDLWTPLHLVMFAAAFLPLVALWHGRVIGGADVKLILACLVWIEPADSVVFAALVALIGALLGLAMLVTQRAILAAMKRRIFSWDQGRFYLRLMVLRDLFLGNYTTVPYAVAIAAAQIVTIAMSAR